MQPSLLKLLAPAVLGLGLAATASAQAVINVSSDITTSATWTSNNVYRLTQQIFVRPGATLTIEAGTLIASTAGLGGSLAVSRGGQIFAEGTKDAPIIFTSTADTATWAGGEFGPRETGTWREAANEWGNVTIMGEGYISENAANVRSGGGNNVPTFDANNEAIMEGLVEAFPGDPDVRYGGGNDDDDSGTLSYVSFRYGGNVIGLNNELNGLSLGGIGRETDIVKVEIMNNVDDGIEIWGGAVCPRYVSIWNIGDDSFDIDQGWRGAAQWVFIVQGYSLNAGQGSGVGDNAFEHDGGENSFWQPTTAGRILNATVIGQPSSDGMTAWRDNCRMQYSNCLFIEGGDNIVRPDGDDGDGAAGYGAAGTLSFNAHWSTTADVATSPVYAAAYPNTTGALATLMARYSSQRSGGNLCEIIESQFYRVDGNPTNPGPFGGLGGFAPANNNLIDDANLPIAALNRAGVVVRGGLPQERVTFVDPRPVGAARNAGVPEVPSDKFDCIAVKGAFAEDSNWLSGWTASEQFGFTPNEDICPIGGGTKGANGTPVLGAGGATMSGAGALNVRLSNTLPSAFASILINGAVTPNNFLGLELQVDLTTSASTTVVAGPNGELTLPLNLPPLPANLDLVFQAIVIDPTVSVGPFNLPVSVSTATVVTVNG